ncbi:zinc finger and SCAN domain-containing protein 22 isoform X2 [Oncorhynchus mykiss]|uniref:zinc finger and SCAN domain-containing protein 22 isoform X2 n=1 Tax=Oncorhynchus mykiss TaxID=8022 RepID=UPI001877C901|nr:zinc finger and SCAN domain-containing protein 22 isoform X2 [Oncorhynchus mykiss]
MVHGGNYTCGDHPFTYSASHKDMAVETNNLKFGAGSSPDRSCDRHGSELMADSVETFQTHLTSVMDSLIRASVCEITKLFQDTVNDFLVEISLNRNEMEALKLRLRLTENKLRNERKYGMGWAENRRNAGLIGSEDGGRKKRKIEVPRGKQKLGPAFGGVWEEGGAAAGEVAGGGWKEARQMYLIHVPGDEEEEEEGELLEEGCISGEGEETDIIKEESGDMVDGGYQPASLRLIKEALKMDPPNQNCHGSRTHSEGDMELSPVALKRPLAVRPEEGDEEEWDVGSPPTEVSEGALSVVDLSGLETALRAERGREQAALKIPPTAGSNHGSRTPDPEVVADSEFSLGQKYIGLDGLEQKGELESPTASERDYGDALQVHGARLKELQGSLPVGAGRELQPRWPKRLRDGEGMGEPGGSDEGLHHLSAPGSVDDSGEEETGDLMHFCMQCGGGFANEAELEEHPCPLGDAHLQEGGTENTLFPCASCGHAFSHAWALKNHECVCAAERPHRCELCGKGFTHSRSLERHQVVHTGERQHCCQQCGRSFSRLGNLERHQRIHTGERPYGCEACGKRFSRVEYLKRHQLIHSGDRDKAGSAHQCSQCGKSFGEPEQLKNHECFS